MKNRYGWKTVLVVMVGLVVPMSSFTVFVMQQRQGDDELITTIYNRQLSSVLFSVNQKCWDLFGLWSLPNTPDPDSGLDSETSRELRLFIDNNDVVAGVFFVCGEGKSFGVLDTAYARREFMARGARGFDDPQLIAKLYGSEIEKTLAHARKGYVRPLALPWKSASGEATTAVLVPTRDSLQRCLGGFVLYDSVFVAEIVQRAINELEDGPFVFSVRSIRSAKQLLGGAPDPAGVSLSTPLWILPDLELSVVMAGQSLLEITRQRTHRVLIMLLFVNLVVIVGVWYLIRSFSREMVLARKKTDFVANVSHELRTPLAMISMYAETLEMGRVAGEEKKQQYYRTILNESRRLNRLIETILDFFRIESGHKRYRPQEVDVNCIVNEAVELYRYHCEQNGFKITCTCAMGLPLVQADCDAASLALINLLDNAVKYSGGVREIDVGARYENEQVQVWVADRGIGIAESERELIFEQFYRVESSLVHATKGSGLGLSLVKQIMLMHRGKVAVQGREGGGTIFTLFFPAV